MKEKPHQHIKPNRLEEKSYHHGNLRSQLIEAGIELINEDGLKGFSLRKVAAKCNVSHAAPYSHFKDIDALISAMGDYVTEQFMDKLLASIDGREDDMNALSLLGMAYIEFFIENPPYFQFLFYYSGLTVDLDNENSDDYPPFALFRSTANKMFHGLKMPEQESSKNLIALWATVHGIVSLLTTNGIQYSGDWRDIFKHIITQKG